jgi:hypothetical protein
VGSHITWILFTLHAPDSKFCTDGRMKVSRPKHEVTINMKYIGLFDLNQKRILLSFSLIKGVTIPGLRPLACQDLGSNPAGGHGCFFCCVLWGRDLCEVQRSPTDCGVSVCDLEASITRGPWPTQFQLIHDTSRQRHWWMLPDAVIQSNASDDGRKHYPKHVELTRNNKLTCIFASRWLYS